MDGSGRWHGGFLESQKRYNVLMADGHVVNQNRDQYFRTWNADDPPSGCSGVRPVQWTAPTPPAGFCRWTARLSPTAKSLSKTA